MTAAGATPSAGSNRSGGFLLKANEWALLASILAVIAATALLDRNQAYLKKPGIALTDNARRLAPLGIMALGATVVIIAGGIDLSAGATAAFSGTLCATVMLALGGEQFDSKAGVGWGVFAAGVTTAVVAGLVIGTLHTWMITALRLPPFIVTLGSLVGLRSLARAYCYYMTGVFKGSTSEDLPFSDPLFDMLKDRVEIGVLVMLGLAGFTWLVLSQTVLGRHVYAMGGNEQAARLSGVRTENVKWFAYCFSAVTASLAGVFYISEGGAKPSSVANGYELNAIAAAVVGGCSLQGGVGTIWGTLLGAVFLRAVVDSVARLIKTSSSIYEGMIVGVVVVLAVTFSQFRELTQSGRQLFAGPLGWVALPCLALAAGFVMLSTLGQTPGYVALGLALAVLGGVKGWEHYRGRRDAHT